MLFDADPDVRRSAIEQLGSERGPAVQTALAAALRDEDQGVRDAAMRSLLAVGGEETARLVAGYIADANIVTRNLAGSILMQLGAVSAPAILPSLEDPDHNVRKFALDILGAIKKHETVDAIIPLLDDEDANVVVSAAEALGNIGNPRAIPSLVKTFSTHEYARTVVLEAIGKLHDPSVLPFVERTFAQAVKESKTDPLFLFTLLEALGALGNRDTLWLVQSHVDKMHEKLRRAAVKAMIQISRRTGCFVDVDERFKSSLIELLHAEDAEVSEYAARFLASDQSGEVTRCLVKALGRFENLDALLTSILCDRIDTLTHAVQLLTESPSLKKAPIVRLLGTIAAGRNFAALKVLFQPGGETLLAGAFDAIRDAWEEADEEMRSLVIDGLFLYDGARAVEFLRGVLDDADPWLRAHIVELLGKVTHAEVERLLMRLAGDESEIVRELAFSVLLQRGYTGGEPLPVVENRTPSDPPPILELR